MLAKVELGYVAETPDPAFPAALRDKLLAKARTLNVRRGQIIIAEGSRSTDVYFVRSGRVQVSLFSAQGKETIVRDIGPDNLFGELAAIDLKPRSACVVALENTNLAYLTGSEFLEFLETVPAAGLWIARLFAEQVRKLTDTIFELSTMPVAARLQRELLRLCQDVGDEQGRAIIARLPTHAEFAARIGTHREAVTREFRSLTEEGIVAQTGRTLIVHSISKLEELSARFFA